METPGTKVDWLFVTLVVAFATGGAGIVFGVTGLIDLFGRLASQ